MCNFQQSNLLKFCFFSSMRMTHGMRRSKEVKRFIYYSLYAWGFPFLMTILTFLADMYAVIPKEIKPDIGKSSCWFDSKETLQQIDTFIFDVHLIYFLTSFFLQKIHHPDILYFSLFRLAFKYL